jgi:hypothetical protein
MTIAAVVLIAALIVFAIDAWLRKSLQSLGLALLTLALVLNSGLIRG